MLLIHPPIFHACSRYSSLPTCQKRFHHISPPISRIPCCQPSVACASCLAAVSAVSTIVHGAQVNSRKSMVRITTFVISQVITSGEPFSLVCKKIHVPDNGHHGPSALAFPRGDLHRVQCLTGYRLRSCQRARWLYGFLQKRLKTFDKGFAASTITLVPFWQTVQRVDGTIG